MSKRITKLGTALLLLIICCAGVSSAHRYQREIRGTVMDRDGEPLRGAVVQLKDLTSLEVRSYITPRNGAYKFHGLYTETDYELRVQYRGKFTRPKRVSRLSSHRDVNVNFRVELPGQ